MDTNFNIRQINDQISAQSSVLGLIRQGVEQRIVGQQHLVDSLLVALLCNGHVLLEGVPGLAKTLAINTLAHVSTHASPAYSSPPTCCRPTSPAPSYLSLIHI